MEILTYILDSISPANIFMLLIAGFWLLVVFLVCRVLSSAIRLRITARRNAREFAASLPLDEQADFWRIYKERNGGTRA